MSTQVVAPAPLLAVHLNGGHDDPVAHKNMAFSAARMSKPPSAELLAFYVVPRLNAEKRQFNFFLEIDLAHLVMLHEQKIVDPTVSMALFPMLLELQENGVEAFDFDIEKGSMLLQIENALVARTGEDIAGRLHTARSRLDQGATVRRLTDRAGFFAVLELLQALRGRLIGLSVTYTGTYMPTHTHMQQSQPGDLGHYFASIAARLADDFARCREAYSRLNRSPLGTVGLAGTSWPTNRARTAELLGFDGMIDNSRRGIESYYAVDLLHCLASLLSTLGDMATDLHLWSSAEFGYLSMDDAFCSTSSIFPQKKNPVALELLKSQAGLAVNWAGTALARFRGAGTGDHAIRNVPLVTEALNATKDMLQLANPLVAGVQVDENRMRAHLRQSWATTSNLADELVRSHQLSFRAAHHVVARLVRIADERGVSRDQVTTEMQDEAAQQTIGHAIHMPQAKLVEALDPFTFVQTRTSWGGPSIAGINTLIKGERESLADDGVWLRGEEQRVLDAKMRLREVIRGIML